MIVRRLLPLAPVALLVLGAAACAPKPLPKPPASAHRADEFAEVPFPPPAVKGDKVPAKLGAEAVWLDGEWRWQGRRWIWSKGSWVTPPPGATFARWDTKRDGSLLLHAPGLFHLVDGTALSPDALRENGDFRERDVPCVAPPTMPAASSAALEEAPSGGPPSFPPCAAESP